MTDAKRLIGFFRKQVGRFGTFSLVLFALEQIVDDDFVCPCEGVYNITVCVLYGAVPSVGCFLFTFSFMELKTEDRWRCNKLLYSSLTASIWLFIFFSDGRYLACALTDWEGVYAQWDTLGNLKWCKPTGNESSVVQSQRITLKWISTSQIVGFLLLLVVLMIFGCVHICESDRTHRNIIESDPEAEEHSRMKLHTRVRERKLSCELEEVTCL